MHYVILLNMKCIDYIVTVLFYVTTSHLYSFVLFRNKAVSQLFYAISSCEHLAPVLACFKIGFFTQKNFGQTSMVLHTVRVF